MAGFSSLDDMINQITNNGKFFRADWNKNVPTVQTATATWYSLLGGAGNPSANTLLGTGTALSHQVLGYDSANSGGIYHGGHADKVADGGYKNILNVSAFSASSTTMPCILMLVDFLAYYPLGFASGAQTLINSVASTSITSSSGLLVTYGATWDIATYTKVQLTTAGTLPTGLALATDYWVVRQSATTCKLATTYENAESSIFVAYTDAGSGAMTMTARLPRYSDGKGVQAFYVPSTVMGAATPTMTLTYTNKDGVGGKTTPSSPALPTGTTACPVSQVAHSGTGAGKYGPFVPLASGDGGIRLPTVNTLSVSYVSGQLNLVLCKPILTLPLTTLGVAAERDCLNQVASLPRVYDGACLGWMIYNGAATPANSPFYGHIDLAYS